MIQNIDNVCSSKWVPYWKNNPLCFCKIIMMFQSNLAHAWSLKIFGLITKHLYVAKASPILMVLVNLIVSYIVVNLLQLDISNKGTKITLANLSYLRQKYSNCNDSETFLFKKVQHINLKEKLNDSIQKYVKMFKY